MQAEFDQVALEPPRVRLHRVCQAYVDFALQEPRLFELMFSSTPLDFENPRLVISSGLAYEQLIAIVHPLFDEKSMDEKNREQTEILVWSVVHGYASLLMNKRERYKSACDEDYTADTALPDLKLLGQLIG